MTRNLSECVNICEHVLSLCISDCVSHVTQKIGVSMATGVLKKPMVYHMENPIVRNRCSDWWDWWYPHDFGNQHIGCLERGNST